MEQATRQEAEAAIDPFRTAELLRASIVAGKLPDDEKLPQLAVERFRSVFGRAWSPDADLPRFTDNFLSIPPDRHQLAVAYLSGVPDDLLEALFGSDVRRQIEDIFTPIAPEAPPPPIVATTYESTARRGLQRQKSTVPRPADPEDSNDPLEKTQDDEPDQQLTATRLTQDPISDYLRQIGKVPLLTAEQEAALAKSIEAGVFAQERLDSPELPRPSQTTDAELRELARIGQSAKQQMIEANLRLVVYNAKHFRGRGVSFIDLIQEGNLGLIRAIEKFDYRQGNKLSTYATWWIKQSITRAIQDQSATIRVPVHTHERINRVRRASKQFLQDNGREPSVEELALKLNSAPKKVEELLGYMRNLHLYSLDQPLSDEAGAATLGDVLHDDGEEILDRSIVAQDRVEALRSVIETLPEREYYVINARFGLETGKPMTLEGLSKSLGITRERVRQIEAKALSKLRHPSRNRRIRGLL